MLCTYDGKIVMVDNVYIDREEKVYHLTYGEGKEVFLTGEHRILCEDDKEVSVKDLKEGDKILTEYNDLAEVKFIALEDYQDDLVYNFSFKNEDNGVYIIANGIWAGDFFAQNKGAETRQISKEEIESIIREMEEIRN